MRQSRLLPVYLFLLLITTVSKADADTVSFLPFSAEYRGEAKGMTIEKLGSRKLSDLGNQQYRIDYKAEALVYTMEETSVFTWQDGMPKPVSYKSSRGTILKKRKSEMSFDWPNQQINFKHKGKKGKLSLSEGMQDPLSSTMFLAAALQLDKSEIKFDEAVGHKISSRHFILKGKTKLETPLGIIPTYHLQRVHDDPERQTDIWLHEEYPYIPVKVKQDDDGDLFLLELTQFKIEK